MACSVIKWLIFHKIFEKMWFVERSLFAILRTILQAKKIVTSTQLAVGQRLKDRDHTQQLAEDGGTLLN